MSNAPIPQEVWDHQVTADAPQAVDWLWHGFLASANLTLLTSQWKAGKTTLLSLLLARRKQGGQLAGLAVKPGKTVVVSEEPLALWSERARRHDFGGQVCFICRPFRTIPAPADWQELLDRILALHQQHGIDLAVFDPLAPFLRCENLAQSVLETLLPLRALTTAGLAVWLLHHPGKGEKPIGQAARGSGALLGHVDISIEMRHPGGDPLTRQRRFLSLSRHAETPRRLVLELNAEGNDYGPVADPLEADFEESWPTLRMVLEDAPQKLTRGDILAEWPPDYARPQPTKLWRWLDHALRRGLIACEGAGRKRDPFRYWLPEREAAWRADPLYEMFEDLRIAQNLPFRSLQEKKRVWRKMAKDPRRATGTSDSVRPGWGTRKRGRQYAGTELHSAPSSGILTGRRRPALAFPATRVLGMIPPFTDDGYLPPGIHRATLPEIASRFGQEPELRQAQMDSLRWLLDLAKRVGVERLIIDGSFVTDKWEPNDVDCVLLAAHDFPRDEAAELELRDGLPFIQLAIVDEQLYDRYVQAIFGTDRKAVAKGMIEVIL